MTDVNGVRDARARPHARVDRGLPLDTRRAPARCSAPGERFAYNNGGFVVLALIAERASGEPFHRPRGRAGVRAGGYARHRLPAIGRAPGRMRPSATSATDRPRTNVFHLPVRGTGDGGIYSTAADLIAVLGRPLRGPDRVGRCRRRDGAPTERLARRRSAGTGSGSACTRRPMS